jgi:hypothetical protein
MSLKFVKFLFWAILTHSLHKDVRELFYILHTVSHICWKPIWKPFTIWFWKIPFSANWSILKSTLREVINGLCHIDLFHKHFQRSLYNPIWENLTSLHFYMYICKYVYYNIAQSTPFGILSIYFIYISMKIVTIRIGLCMLLATGQRARVSSNIHIGQIIFFHLHSGGWNPNCVHSARRPFTGLLCLPRVIVRMENLLE